MTDRPVTAVPGTTPAPPARLEPNAIGVAQDTVIGLASSAPAATMAVTLAGVALAAAYGGGAVIILCGVPMLILANAYRRLNLWNANCGASFEWVGRSINPYLGFFTGWLMLAGYLVGSISVVVVLAPSVLAIFGANATSTWPNIGISTGLILVMLAIAVAGIRITARTQVGMAVIEYAVLVGISIWGLVFVLGHHHGTFPITRGWFSLSGIGGKGSLATGSSSRSSCIPAGTPPSTSTRKSSTGASTRAGPLSWRSRCSSSCTSSRRWACREWCRRPTCRLTRPRRWSTSPRLWAAAGGPR